MRIAAGVLIILVALFDLFGGLYYFGGGALVGSGRVASTRGNHSTPKPAPKAIKDEKTKAEVQKPAPKAIKDEKTKAEVPKPASKAIKDEKTKATHLSAKEKEASRKMDEALAKWKAWRGWLMLIGIFLIIISGLDIAAGVVLFREKAATFAIVVGGLQVVGEFGSIFAKSKIGDSPFDYFNMLGLAAAGLVIFAAMQYKDNPDADTTPESVE